MTTTKRLALAATLLAAAGSAAAHTGHGTESFFTGLAHPLGADHLLAMVAVGLWSVFALPARRAWQGPVTFLVAMVLGATFGAGGLELPGLEHAIAASVVLLGVMLIGVMRQGVARRGAMRPAATRALPAGTGLALLAAAGALHGVAHGAEAPVSSGFAAYALGFLATTVAAHLGGVLAGVSLRRGLAAQAPRVLAALGLALGGAGLYLLGPL